MPETFRLVPAYVICATPRTGSTLICDLLAATGVAGKPDSFYRIQSIGDFMVEWGLDLAPPYEGEMFERAYLAAALQKGRAGTGQFGIRVMWPSISEMDARFAPLFPEARTTTERFAAAFGAPRYIFLRRLDKIAQAVSRFRAEQSGLWHRHTDGSERERVAPSVPPSYDEAAIAGFIAETAAHEKAWTDWFAAHAISPLIVTYEDLAATPFATLATVLSALGHDPALAGRAEIGTVRLSDAVNRDWAARFRDRSRPES